MAVRNTDLSVRERQVLELSAGGHTDVSIAQQLEISPKTIGTYWNRIRAKIGPYSRTELVAKIFVKESSDELAALQDKYEALLRQVNGGVDPVTRAEMLPSAPGAKIIVKGMDRDEK